MAEGKGNDKADWLLGFSFKYVDGDGTIHWGRKPQKRPQTGDSDPDFHSGRQWHAKAGEKEWALGWKGREGSVMLHGGGDWSRGWSKITYGESAEDPRTNRGRKSSRNPILNDWVWKTPTQECTLHDAIYRTFKNRQKSSMLLETEGRGTTTGKARAACLRGPGHVTS